MLHICAFITQLFYILLHRIFSPTTRMLVRFDCKFNTKHFFIQYIRQFYSWFLIYFRFSYNKYLVYLFLQITEPFSLA